MLIINNWIDKKDEKENKGYKVKINKETNEWNLLNLKNELCCAEDNADSLWEKILICNNSAKVYINWKDFELINKERKKDLSEKILAENGAMDYGSGWWVHKSKCKK